MKAKLEIIGGPLDGTEAVVSGETTIGRDEGCAVSVPLDRHMSKKHAVLRPYGDGYVLEDLRSTNGTFFDDEPILKPVRVAGGEIFKLGRTLVKIDYA